MTMLANPVLPGFSPDPSLIKVGDWFYLANSSFEWNPVVPIHRSRDLKEWEFAGSFESPDAELDLRGLKDSGGVWAPSLSWSGGMFWLVFTVVRGFGGPQKDMDTYITRAENPAGPWSRPVRVTTMGFDPSIFHHEGRHWLLNMEWDHRPTSPSRFAGINIQELSSDAAGTIGEPITIHRRSELIEGPNLYHVDGKFYLMLAEGGTGQNHGIAMMRADELFGPYIPDPHGPVLTARDDSTLPLQKAGHGEIAVDSDGQLFLVHLASRWQERDGVQYSVLGRESCIQRLRLTSDGWIRLEQGGWHPAVEIEGPSVTRELVATTAELPPKASAFGGFNPRVDAAFPHGPVTVGWPWNTLRQAASEDWASLSARPGWLRLRGRHSTDSLIDQSLVARRLTSLTVTAGVTVEASPWNYAQSAGLIFYYNTSSYFYLRRTVREVDGKLLAGERPTEHILEVFEQDPSTGLTAHGAVAIEPGIPIRLAGAVRSAGLQFFWAQGDSSVVPIGPELNALQLSDDHGDALRFTGAFVGVAAQDLRDRAFTADFTDFTYETQ